MAENMGMRMCMRIQDMPQWQAKESKDLHAEKSSVDHSSSVTGHNHVGAPTVL